MKTMSKKKSAQTTIRQIKKMVSDMVKANDFKGIYELVAKEGRAISALISMSYDKSSELSWRALHMAGRVIGELANDDYDAARGQVQRIIWNTSDESGTIPWTAPELLGEIVRRNPEPFKDIPPIIEGYAHSETEDNIFLAGVLYALGRIGELHEEYIDDEGRYIITEELAHKDPEVCANAIIAAGKLKMELPDDVAASLLTRQEEVKIFRDEKLISVRIDELVRDQA